MAQPQDPRLRSGVAGCLHLSWRLLVHVLGSLDAWLHSERRRLGAGDGRGVVGQAEVAEGELADQQVTSAGIRRRVPQLRQGPYLDLADALARQVEALADLFQCPGFTVVEAET